MSVINQMLKDLEERSPEQSSTVSQPTTASPSHSSTKLVLVTTLCVLSICFVSFYIWQLVNENQALKAEKINTSNVDDKASKTNINGEPAIANRDKELLSATTAPASKTPARETISPKQVDDKSIAKQSANNKQRQTPVENKRESHSTTTQHELVAPKEHKANITIRKNSSTKVTPASKNPQIEADEAHGHSHVKKSTQSVVTSAEKPTVNKMSVSRRQLTADELAQQKLSQAEKALAAKQVSKAEKLFEDVIIIKPSDSQTRKRLAALWFGRQAYQDALNLLSQGIALDGKDKSLRELKARIHLKQGQVRAAVNTLKPLAKLADEQYQIMLANTAQQAQQNDIAIGAYQMLIKMQPDLGRWQLGLAVLYDKNSQFTLASKAYKTALTKSDLSISSEKFVKQRIEVIGQ